MFHPTSSRKDLEDLNLSHLLNEAPVRITFLRRGGIATATVGGAGGGAGGAGSGGGGGTALGGVTNGRDGAGAGAAYAPTYRSGDRPATGAEDGRPAEEKSSRLCSAFAYAAGFA